MQPRLASSPAKPARSLGLSGRVLRAMHSSFGGKYARLHAVQFRS